MNTTEDGTPLGEYASPREVFRSWDDLGESLAKDLVRDVVRSNIGIFIAVFDAHDPGIYRAVDVEAAEDLYRCPDVCGGFIGTRSEWERHLADKLADALIAVSEQ